MEKNNIFFVFLLNLEIMIHINILQAMCQSTDLFLIKEGELEEAIERIHKTLM